MSSIMLDVFGSCEVIILGFAHLLLATFILISVEWLRRNTNPRIEDGQNHAKAVGKILAQTACAVTLRAIGTLSGWMPYVVHAVAIWAGLSRPSSWPSS